MKQIPTADRRSLAILLAALLIGAGLLAVWRWSSTPGPPITVEPVSAGEAVAGLPEEPVSGADPPPTITVHVVGPVRSPGVVVLPEGARVLDAATAAGGLSGPGPPSDVNLARVLTDGELVDLREPVPPGPGQLPGPALVDLNTASAPDLQALPGVGPVLAERIVEYRNDYGPFQAIDQLLEVPGIGPAKFADLEDAVRVGGG